MVQDLNLCANPWIAKTCSVQLLHIAVSLSTFSFFLSFPCLSDIWWRENGPCSSMQMRLSLKIMKYHSRWLFSDIIFKNYFLCNWFSVVSPSIFLLPLSVFSFPSWFWMERKCSWNWHAQKTISYKHLRYYLVLIYFSQNFSGQKNLQPSRRPPPYPSQHTSHFSIGIVPGHDLDTHSRKTFVRHHTSPVSEVPVISIILNIIRLMYGPEGNS